VNRRLLGRTIVQVLAVALAGLLLLVAYAIYRITAQGLNEEARPADAIVVLGAAQFNGQPSTIFEARLQHAVDLWKEGLAPYLVVTGGKLPADITTEAATARAWAIAHGVPEEAILGEYRGRNTLESLEGVEAILARQDLHSAVFVSDETHMLRVLRMASDLGITAWGSPTRTSPSDLEPDRRWRAIVHELAGLAAYYVGGGHLFEESATITSP
jgi:uncharacterized SAM-binding protein YcdF (DUF218 family)